MTTEQTKRDTHLLTYQQVADRLGIRVPTLYVMVHRLRIPHIRLSGRMVRFDPAEVDQWLDERRVQSRTSRNPRT